MQNEVVLLAGIGSRLQRVAGMAHLSGKFSIPRGDILRFGLCVKAKAKATAKAAVIVLGFF